MLKLWTQVTLVVILKFWMQVTLVVILKVFRVLLVVILKFWMQVTLVVILKVCRACIFTASGDTDSGDEEVNKSARKGDVCLAGVVDSRDDFDDVTGHDFSDCARDRTTLGLFKEGDLDSADWPLTGDNVLESSWSLSPGGTGEGVCHLSDELRLGCACLPDKKPVLGDSNFGYMCIAEDNSAFVVALGEVGSLSAHCSRSTHLRRSFSGDTDLNEKASAEGEIDLDGDDARLNLGDSIDDALADLVGEDLGDRLATKLRVVCTCIVSKV
ncbi:hypothetical protein ACOMHN_036725 [Nucella lapillus]